MHHLYISLHSDEHALRKERERLVAWCEMNGVGEYDFIEEGLDGIRVSKQMVSDLLASVHEGDVVVASTVSRLGRSLNMLASSLRTIHSAKAALMVVSERKMYLPDAETDAWIRGIEYASQIATDIRTERSNEALFASKAKGRALGRPVGAKSHPSKNVLHGRTDELMRLRAEGLSPQKIALQLGVSRGTVYNYLKNKKVPE